MTDQSLLLEAVHPDGPALGVAARGDGAARLANDPYALGHAGTVLVAPSPEQRRDRAWAQGLAAELTGAAPNALVMLSSGSAALREEIAAAGFSSLGRIVHVPDLISSRQIFPVSGPDPELPPADALAAELAKSRRLRVMRLFGRESSAGVSSELLGRPRLEPPFSWLRHLDPSVPSCTAVASTSGRRGAANVLFRISAGRAPDLVVKVGGRADLEAAALRQLGPMARAAGASIPEVTWSGRRAGAAILAQTPLAGEPGMHWVAGRSGRARELTDNLARWVLRWNELTASREALSEAMLKRVVLHPAARLSRELGVERYLERLERLCAVCRGRPVPLVASHDDLTMANLLVENGGGFGVVDWEQGRPATLPLGDLTYALVDGLAAVSRYRDRAAAFDACFGTSRAFTEQMRRLVYQSAVALRLDRDVVELCMHACWLHHAANEQALLGSPASPRPFLEILRRAALRPALSPL